MSRTKKIAVLAIIAMVLTLMPAAMFAATADSTRLSGASRIETALDICSAGFSTADTVILAAADQANLVDALAAAPLAGTTSPILLTGKAGLDPAVKAKIAALGAKKVYVIGAVSKAVSDEVAAMSGVTVERLSGDSRWATADAINAKLTNPAGTFVVGYNAIADALSVASFAGKNNYRIVLADTNGTVASSKLAGTVYTVGGGVAAITGATSLAGTDRFATNKAVAEKLSYAYDRVYVANGLSLVDALAVAPVAAKYGAFVALASASDVAAASVINTKISATSKVIAVGGTSAVSDAVVGKVAFQQSEPTTTAVTVASYDDDTSNQYVAFTVNDQKADVNTLNSNGWDVEFSAYDAKTAGNDITANYFDDVTVGLLSDSLTAADIYVQVVLTKGSDIITSSRAKVTIKNLNLTATGISKYKLTNTTGTAFVQESTTLVVGETAEFTNITVTNGDAKEVVTSGYTIKTSDASVVSKNNTDITAEAPGNATITITYGAATKTVSFTIVNDAREIKKVRVKSLADDSVVTSFKLALNAAGLKAEALDQYGDPVPGGILAVTSSNAAVVTANYVEPTLALTKGATPSTATVSFYDAAVGGNKIGSISVTTSNNTDVANKIFGMWTPATDAIAANDVATTIMTDFSTDTTIDAAADKYVVYQLTQLNSDGYFLGTSVVTVDSLQSSAGVANVSTYASAVGTKVLVEGLKAGTLTLKVTDSDTGKLYTVKITVVDQGYSIKSVSFKSIASPTYAKTFDWKSALNYNLTGNDPIITGITLNKTAAQSIRLDTVTGTLYIDKDANGVNSAGDIELGTLVMTTVGTFTNAVAGLSIDTVSTDDGTVIYKIWNPAGDKVLASKSVTVEL